jgi:hypothetical protein
MERLSREVVSTMAFAVDHEEQKNRRGVPRSNIEEKRKVMAKTTRSLIGLSLLLAAISASAQVRHAIKVTVPFPFVTSEKSWPAADYEVEITPKTAS